MHIVIFLLVLATLVIVHEFGHFIVAKMVGMKVEEFAVGFPPRLWSKKVGDTLYSINLIFVGGFVKIFGETEGTEKENNIHDSKLERKNKSGSFSSKSRLAQAAVVLAGVCMNFIAAWFMLVGAYAVGVQVGIDDTNRALASDAHIEIMGVMPKAPAEHAGIIAGDTLLSMQTGSEVLDASSTASQASDFITKHGDESIVVSVARKGVKHNFVAIPQAGVISSEPNRKAIGVSFADVGTIQPSFQSAFVDGTKLFMRESVMVAQGLGGFFLNLFSGSLNMNEVSGPVGIARIGGAAAQDGAGALLMFAAMVSINLAFVNFLPIPGLDGGRLIFIVIESVIGKAIHRRWYDRFATAGFTLLISLMLFVTYHDIFR